jgi:hypothetical protein
MTQKQYLNFDLLVEVNADVGNARVLDSPAGQARTTFAYTLATTMNHTAQQPIDVGARLFDTVLSGEVGTCLRRSMDEAARQGVGLRLRLRLDNPDLMTLPWEYLYDTTRARFLALSTTTPIVRYVELPEPITPLPVSLPLHILVVIANPYDYAPLQVEHEWSQIQLALSGLVERQHVTIERLQTPTLGALQERLREHTHHILHFIGHGEGGGHGRQGTLIFGGPEERGVAVNGFTLGTLLRDHPSMRLLVLNACSSAESDTANPFNGVAQQSIQQGIAAAIAMRGAISDHGAVSFSQTFYDSLTSGFAVDAALAEARKAMYASGELWEWAMPVLFMRSSDSHLWQLNDAVQPINEQQPWWEQLPPQAGGDVIIAEIGAGASGVAVGKGITQTIMTVLGPIQPNDKTVIEQKFTQLLDALKQPKADTNAQTIAMAEFQLQLLKGELTKTGEDEVPSANTLTQVGDWLLNNVPQIAEILAGLFATPAVGKVVGKAGSIAVDWVKRRFSAA